MKNQVLMKLSFNNFLILFGQSFKNYNYWIYSAKINTYKRYRRSVLGPWWLTLNLLIFISSVGLLWAYIWKVDLRTYVPFFAFGIVFWELVQSTILKSIGLYKLKEGVIKSINVNKLNYHFEVITIVIINFLHNCAFIIPLSLLICFYKGSYAVILLIPTMLIYLLNMFFISILISILSTRYKDLEMVIEHLLRIIFLMTPIIWLPTIFSEESMFIKYNFLYHYLEIFRAPLMGQIPTVQNYLITFCSTLVFMVLGIYTYLKYNKKIVFWI